MSEPIRLYQFPTAWGLPNLSPFCMKANAYLRLAGIPHQVKTLGDPRGAPKKKLPFIEHGGTRIADSSLIIGYLKQQFGDPLDASLTEEQAAVGHALRRMLEEHTYFVAIYYRWVKDAGWEIVSKHFLKSVPAVVRAILGPMLRRRMRQTLYAQGIGRHSDDEIRALGLQDLEVLRRILGDKPFLFGDTPSSFDCVAWSFVANALEAPIPSPLKDWCAAQPGIVDYARRMRERYDAAEGTVVPKA